LLFLSVIKEKNPPYLLCNQFKRLEAYYTMSQNRLISYQLICGQQCDKNVVSEPLRLPCPIEAKAERAGDLVIYDNKSITFIKK